MAIQIRNENDLATLRCEVRLQSRKPVLVTRAFIGSEALDDPLIMEIPNSVDGIGLVDLDNGSLNDNLSTLVSEAANGAPIWLQIAQDSHLAALIPWEQWIAEQAGRSTFRIPNFLRNPYVPKRRARMAICTSAPRAKGGPDLLHEVRRLLSAVGAGFHHPLFRLDVTIFPDVDDFHSLVRLVGTMKSELNRIRVKVLDPRAEEVGFEPAPRSFLTSESSTVSNPWLHWINRHYKQTGVDAVHFICPGYLSRDSSALALAESPLENIDESWARFVGPQELATFYDRLGCSIMGFTAIGAKVWADGIHALGYQMSWTRAGPVIVDEEGSATDGLSAIYGAIFVGNGMANYAPSATSSYVHPSIARFNGTDDVEEVFAPHLNRVGPLVFENSATGAPSQSGNKPLGTDARNFDLLEGTDIRELYADPFAGPDLSAQILELERARISTVKSRTNLEEARDAGALKALDFLQEVLKK